MVGLCKSGNEPQSSLSKPISLSSLISWVGASADRLQNKKVLSEQAKQVQEEFD